MLVTPDSRVTDDDDVGLLLSAPRSPMAPMVIMTSWDTGERLVLLVYPVSVYL